MFFDVKISGLLILINFGLTDRYMLMNEQQKIEAEQLAQEEREAMEELKRKQVKLERPIEDTSLVNGIPGDVTFVSSENRVQHISGMVPEVS
jgi:dihydroxyacid dehydratase/phosphogluconate dehydratase